MKTTFSGLLCHVEQINRREGETATFLSRDFVTFACVLAVSPHVSSIVRHFSANRQRRSPMQSRFSAKSRKTTPVSLSRKPRKR